MRVVLEHRDRHHVARVHRHLVRGSTRRTQLGRRGDGDHPDLAGRGLRPVRHRVLEGDGSVESTKLRDAQHLMTQHRDRHPGVVRDPDRLDDEHPARRVRVVRQHVHECRATGRQHRGVRHDDRRAATLGRHDDVDAHESRRHVRAVRDLVGQVVRPGLVRHERERPGVDVRRDLGGSRLRDRGEAQLVAVGVGVVAQRLDRDGLTCQHDHVVAHWYGWLVRGDDVHEELALDDPALAVGDRERDGLAAGRPAAVAELDRAVRARAHVVARDRGVGGGQVEVVAVGVLEERQDLDLADPALRDLEHRVTGLLRDLVLSPRRDRHRHRRLRDAATSVRHRVAEAARPLRVVRHHRLQRRTTEHVLDGDPLRSLAHEGSRHDVAVGVDVVGEDGQDRGASGAHAERVVLGLRGPVRLGAVGDELVDLLGIGQLGVGLLALGLLGDLHVPVVDLLVLVRGHPQRARGQVVEHDDVPVDPVLQARLRVDALQALVHVVVGASAVADHLPRRAPRAVRAAVELDGCGGGALGRAGERVAAVERLGHQARRGRDDHVLGRCRRLLQDRAVRAVERHGLAARQHELTTRPVQHHRVVTHRSHRDLGPRGHGERRDLRVTVRRASACPDGDQLARRRHCREDGTVPRHRQGAVAPQLRDRLGLRRVERRRPAEGQHPQEPLLAVEDRRRPTARRHLRAGGQPHLAVERQVRDVDRRGRRHPVVVQQHLLLVLLHVERRRPRDEHAVDRLRRVVEPPELPRRRLRHPHPGVVELDVRRRLPLVPERHADHREREHRDGADRRHGATVVVQARQEAH